jgi:hypothetical protein
VLGGTAGTSRHLVSASISRNHKGLYQCP